MTSCISKNLQKLSVFAKFFEGLGVQYGSKIEEDSLKMTMLAPRWAVLGDLGVILRHVGGEMVIKSARMSQHRRQGANPRGFEGSAGLPDGKHTLEIFPCEALDLGGSREILQFLFLRIKVLRFKGLKD